MSGAGLLNPFRFVVPPYDANGVDFDGLNDYLTRGADLTGNADSKLFSGSFWFKRTTVAAAQAIYATALRDYIQFTSGDLLSIEGRNSSDVSLLRIRTSAITDTASWHHAMFSVDMADTGKRHLYLDDVSDLTVSTYTDDTIDFTLTDHAIGGRVNANRKFDACVADVWIAPGQYIDLSVEANRRKFIGSAGIPVDLGSDGSTPTGTAPLMFFSGATANWHTNKGSGGGFIEHGALTNCADSP